jgi:2-amino-4-hydroxy-6-hydroxymethyldihydropteridine diphosphokinase
MATVFLGIGSNAGDRQANIQRATELLKEDKDFTVRAVSECIETEAIGGPPQGRFLNGVIEVETDLLPLQVLSRVKAIERWLGRVKDKPNAPRPMDLDILFYDDVVIVDGKTLTVPHPRLADRYFVLKPLSEIAPDWVHPRLGKTVRELYEGLTRHENCPQS